MNKLFCALLTCLLTSFSMVAAADNVSFRVTVPDEISDKGVCVVTSPAGKSRSYNFKVGEKKSINVDKGEYEIKFFVPGYAVLSRNIAVEEGLDMGEIVLTPDENYIDAAVVATDGKNLRVVDETISYDVSADPLNKTKPLKNILTELPFVKKDVVHDDIEVSLGSYCVLVNGRRNLAINSGNINYVSDILKGEGIKSVSINLAPTGEYAKYEAVIDITTEGNVLKDFYAASIGAGVSDSYSFWPSASATIKTGKLILSSSYGYSHGTGRDSYQESLRTPESGSGKIYYASDTTKAKKSDAHDISVNMSYDATDNDIIFANAQYSFGKSSQQRHSFFGSEEDGLMTPITLRDAAMSSKSSSANGNVSYQHHFKSQYSNMLTLQYSIDAAKNSSEYNAEELRTDNGTTNMAHTLSVDYYRMLSPKLNYYLRAGFIGRHYSSDSKGENLLDYSQNVAFATGNISYRINKLMLTGTMTFDRTEDITSYNNIDYNLRVSWPFAAGHMLIMSTGYSIYRPDLKVLNNYEDESSAGSVTTGNSSLTPQNTLSAMAVYRYFIGSKFSISPLVSYRHSDVGVYTLYKMDESGVLTASAANTGEVDMLYCSVGADWTPTSKFNLRLDYRHAFHWRELENGRNSFTDDLVSIQASWSPLSNTNFDLYMYWTSPEMGQPIAPQTKKIHYMWCESAFSVSRIFKNGLNAYMRLDCPWSTLRKEVREFSVDGYDVLNSSILPRTRVSVGLTWRFGALRDGVKYNSRAYSASDTSKAN